MLAKQYFSEHCQHVFLFHLSPFVNLRINIKNLHLKATDKLRLHYRCSKIQSDHTCTFVSTFLTITVI